MCESGGGGGDVCGVGVIVVDVDEWGGKEG